MPHMIPQIWKDTFWFVEMARGESCIIPTDVVSGEAGTCYDLDAFDTEPGPSNDLSIEATQDKLQDFRPYLGEGCDPKGEIISATCKEGWGAQLTAPGYLDQTDLSVFDTEEEAIEYIVSTYNVDETGNDIPEGLPEGLTDTQIFRREYPIYHFSNMDDDDVILYSLEKATEFMGALLTNARANGRLDVRIEVEEPTPKEPDENATPASDSRDPGRTPYS